MNDGRIYFCVCIVNDCDAVGVGPFRTREQAELEAAVECEYAHAVTDDRRLDDRIEIIWPTIKLTDDERSWTRDWHAARNSRTRCAAAPPSCERVYLPF